MEAGTRLSTKPESPEQKENKEQRINLSATRLYILLVSVSSSSENSSFDRLLVSAIENN